MYLCWNTKETKFDAIHSALIVVSGTAKQNFVKTSNTVSTCVYGDDGSGRKMFICMRSPGNFF